MAGDEIIDRLMSVEREAERLVEGAQEDADRRLRETEQEERLSHESTVAAKNEEISDRLKQLRNELDNTRKQAVASYEKDLAMRPIDAEALDEAVDTILGV